VLPNPPEATLEHRSTFPFERLGAIFEIVLCSGFPTQLLLIGILRGFGMPLLLSEGGFNPTFVFTVSMLDAALVVALVLFLLRVHGESIRDVLLGHGRLLREALFGIALIPIVFFVVVLILGLILTFAPQLHNVRKNPLEDMLRNDTDAAIFAIVVMVAGGLREEVQRGFIVHRFGQYLGGGVVGVLFYSVIFGLGHYEQGYDASLATAALGAIWGFVYLRRRSIVAPVISHAGFNLAQVLKFVALR
jgi:membrane protease YdiL (CAAX protease family)